MTFYFISTLTGFTSVFVIFLTSVFQMVVVNWALSHPCDVIVLGPQKWKDSLPKATFSNDLDIYYMDIMGIKVSHFTHTLFFTFV